MLTWASPCRSCTARSQCVIFPEPGPPSMKSTGKRGSLNRTPEFVFVFVLADKFWLLYWDVNRPSVSSSPNGVSIMQKTKTLSSSSLTSFQQFRRLYVGSVNN